MNRAEAIRHLSQLEDAVQAEYGVGRGDYEQGQKDLKAALGALGVTEHELEHAWDDNVATGGES